MSALEDQVLADKAREYAKALNDHIRQHIDHVFKSSYYMRRSYGKWTIYDKDGKRVAWRLKQQQAEAYLKLLKEEK